MTDVDLELVAVGLVVGALLVVAGTRWVEETIDEATGGLL